jgi:radical SAM-linked protein
MEPSSPALAPSEPRQRWRATYRRRPDAPPLPQREQLAAWEASLGASGLPFAGLGLPASRPRIVFAAPLAVGVSAERELVDLFLVDRRSVAEVRVRLAGSLPAGHELVDVHDVWLGEPPLSGQVVAADYRVQLKTLDDQDPDRARLTASAMRFLSARALPRTREKGGRTIPYDLRPLIADISLVSEHGPAVELRIRTRFDPERGVGRLDEVLAALSELAGMPLESRAIVRERVVLAGEG